MDSSLRVEDLGPGKYIRLPDAASYLKAVDEAFKLLAGCHASL